MLKEPLPHSQQGSWCAWYEQSNLMNLDETEEIFIIETSASKLVY